MLLYSPSVLPAVNYQPTVITDISTVGLPVRSWFAGLPIVSFEMYIQDLDIVWSGLEQQRICNNCKEPVHSSYDSLDQVA